MQQLPEALQPFAAYKQFCLYKLVPSLKNPGKTDKFPVNLALDVVDAHDATHWLDAQTATGTAALLGAPYGVGFVFTEADPFFFFDIDDCLEPGGAAWSPVAQELMQRLPDAVVEVSQSGRGLHLFGTGSPTLPPEQRRKKAKDSVTGETAGLFDLYTEKRFAALTGNILRGNAASPTPQDQLDYIANRWLVKAAGEVTEWTDEPVVEWTGTEWTDAELLDRALKAKSVATAFGKVASFRDLWEGTNADLLSECYPDDQGNGTADQSRVDSALAQHLAFWTGKNCVRMLALMWDSGLVREKWEQREGDYLERTILRAVSLQETVYSVAEVDDTLAQNNGGAKLRGSDAQCRYAEGVRAQKLLECAGNEAHMLALCRISSAKFWIDNKDRTIEAILNALTPVEKAAEPLGNLETGPQLLTGYQYLGATQQLEYFQGCTYIQESHKVFTPTGSQLKPDQFNATFGGYCFQMDDGGEKTTRKAWEAFTESQIIRYPKAEAMTFRPDLPPGQLFAHEDRILLNTYLPIQIRRTVGDVKPFTDHLARILPVQRDREIVLAYMAACVQHIGVKFQWAPLIQGAPGNGKTLLTRCVSAAVGERYTHMPPALEIAEKFNSWLFNKLFIGVEDVFVPEHKQEIIEVLKPMITGENLARRAMQQDQVMHRVCANFMLNSNHRDALRKTLDDRRFAVFFSAQQTKADIERDGMGGNYFPNIYRWLKADGYAIVAEMLYTYPIPEEFNPAGACHRAPETSSTGEAIRASMGGVEQEILEAVAEDRVGFAGGWISSVAVERLLQNIRKIGAIPHNKRRELLQALGYDWHPALPEGRTNNPVGIDDNKKPRLFIKNGHISQQLKTGAEVVRAYQTAQGVTVPGSTKAAEAFAK